MCLLHCAPVELVHSKGMLRSKPYVNQTLTAHPCLAGPETDKTKCKELPKAAKLRRPAKPAPNSLLAGGELIRVPLAWFLGPLRQAMRLRVRPVTSNTRRKQLSVKMQVPKACFDALMRPLVDKGVEGLALGMFLSCVATSTTPRLLRYNYILNKGSLSDSLFRLEEFDKKPKRFIQPKAGKQIPPALRYKRGLGCARLHLSAAAGARGELAQTIAMVCGAVLISYREPKAFRAMGTLELKMFVLSMDHNGHILWPTKFGAKTQAALRRQARVLLQRMMEDPLYPIHPSMRGALDPNVTSGSMHVYKPPVQKELTQADSEPDA